MLPLQRRHQESSCACISGLRGKAWVRDKNPQVIHVQMIPEAIAVGEAASIPPGLFANFKKMYILVL